MPVWPCVRNARGTIWTRPDRSDRTRRSRGSGRPIAAVIYSVRYCSSRWRWAVVQQRRPRRRPMLPEHWHRPATAAQTAAPAPPATPADASGRARRLRLRSRGALASSTSACSMAPALNEGLRAYCRTRVNNYEPRLSQCCRRFRGGGSDDCRDPRVVGVLTVRVSAGHPLSGYDLPLLPMKHPDV